MQQTSVQKQKKFIKNKGGNRMFKKMKHMKNEKGLTLIELLAVIVILAIIAAIAIPAIGNIINNTRDKAVLSDVQAAISAAKIARADGSCTSPCTGAQFEFSSDKIANATTSAGGAEIISIAFDTNGVATVTTTLVNDFKGNKIKGLVTAAASTANNNTTVGTFTSAKVLTITEGRLNSVLGGN